MNTIETVMLHIYRLSFRELAGLVLVGTVAFMLFYYVTRKRKCQRGILLTFSIVYILVIVSTTLLWRNEASVSYGISLIPFASYIKYVQGQTEMLRESIMNIVFFYPLGLLLGGASSEKLPKRKSLLFVFFLSFFIEFCQCLFRLGYAEVDDVMHNTLGAGLGMLVIYAVEKWPIM